MRRSAARRICSSTRSDMIRSAIYPSPPNMITLPSFSPSPVANRCAKDDLLDGLAPRYRSRSLTCACVGSCACLGALRGLDLTRKSNRCHRGKPHYFDNHYHNISFLGRKAIEPCERSPQEVPSFHGYSIGGRADQLCPRTTESCSALARRHGPLGTAALVLRLAES